MPKTNQATPRKRLLAELVRLQKVTEDHPQSSASVMHSMFFRSTTICFFLGFLGLLGINAPASADYPPLVQQAFENMERLPASPWSFLQTTTNREGVSVERCNYVAETCRWTLVSLNGNPPTEKELESFRKDKTKAEDRKGEKSRFDTLAAPGSIVLLEEDAEQAVYRFEPLPEDEKDEKINKQLEGRLVISKAGPYVRSFELVNTGAIKPAMFVKIHKMRIAMEFAPVKEGGPYLPIEMRVIVQGKVGGLKKFEEDKRIEFNEYSLN